MLDAAYAADFRYVDAGRSYGAAVTFTFRSPSGRTSTSDRPAQRLARISTQVRLETQVDRRLAEFRCHGSIALVVGFARQSLDSGSTADIGTSAHAAETSYGRCVSRSIDRCGTRLNDQCTVRAGLP